MRFMNEYDIDNACHRWESHPVLGPASRTIRNLKDAANQNSDGWCYWPKPARSASKLMELIEGNGTSEFFHGEREDATPAKLKAALTPIKAFRTRSGLDFIVDDGTPTPETPQPVTREQLLADPNRVAACEGGWHASKRGQR